MRNGAEGSATRLRCGHGPAGMEGKAARVASECGQRARFSRIASRQCSQGSWHKHGAARVINVKLRAKQGPKRRRTEEGKSQDQVDGEDMSQRVKRPSLLARLCWVQTAIRESRIALPHCEFWKGHAIRVLPMVSVRTPKRCETGSLPRTFRRLGGTRAPGALAKEDAA